MKQITLTVILWCQPFYAFNHTPGPLNWSTVELMGHRPTHSMNCWEDELGLCPIQSINCRANGLLSHLLGKMSSVWARPTHSNYQANWPVNGLVFHSLDKMSSLKTYRANGPLFHALDGLLSEWVGLAHTLDIFFWVNGPRRASGSEHMPCNSPMYTVLWGRAPRFFFFLDNLGPSLNYAGGTYFFI